MTIPQRVAQVATTTEAIGRVKEFVAGCRYLMLNPRGGAEEMARQARASDRIIEFTRSAAAAGSISGWGSIPKSIVGISW